VPGQTNAFFIVEHETGRIWRLAKGADGDQKTPFVDLGAYQKGTRGLLGMALHPQFRENRRYFFVKHLVENGQFSTMVGEREANQDLQSDSGHPTRLIFRWNEATAEIWAWGFREPWRFSFDPKTGDLWVGDVGQDRYEEVDLVRRGENYGWNVYEGFEPFSNRYRQDGRVYVPPIFAYPRKFGVSVTGGFVYRAKKFSSFEGVYVFGDYESRRLFGLRLEVFVVFKLLLEAEELLVFTRTTLDRERRFRVPAWHRARARGGGSAPATRC
jgi:glucose/arabinose dehydrogenase